MPARLAFLPLLVLALAPRASGAVASDDPVTVVRNTLHAALEIARAGGNQDEQLTSLRAVARGILDTRAMGRRAIGDVLSAQPEGRQEEYFDLFDQLIVRAYLQKLLLFRNPRFGYADPSTQGDVVTVRTKIITSKDEYHVDYEMRERDGRWIATDVIVEGISLTDNYRAQFSSLLRNRSFDELLDLMRRTARVPQKPQ